MRVLVVRRFQNPLKSFLNSEIMGCTECTAPKSCSHLDLDMDNVESSKGLRERVTHSQMDKVVGEWGGN